MAELRAVVSDLQSTVAALHETLAARDARIVELERLLEESRRGGKRQAAPFSKGPPKVDPQRPGRKPGGAYGAQASRAVPEQADRTIEAPMPGACPCCGGVIEVVGDAEQWITDLPEAQPVVTRVRVPVGRCRSCHRRIQGRHREQTSDALGAAGSQVGPRAKALAELLHYQAGLSFARAAEILAALGVTVVPSTLVRAAQVTARDLEGTYQALLDEINTARSVTMDETGWRIGGLPAWLWTATTATATAYAICEGRGYADACRLLDACFDGTLIRDGWAPYRKYTQATHQTCLAHLLRRCAEMLTDLPVEHRTLAAQIKTLLTDALAARDLHADARTAAVADLAERLDLLLDQPAIGDANRRLIKHLRTEATALFTFLVDPTVDATNWRGEQAIRPAVVNRKTWGGNRTDHGAWTWSRITSVLRTAHLRGHNSVDLLVGLAREPNPHNAFAIA